MRYLVCVLLMASFASAQASASAPHSVLFEQASFDAEADRRILAAASQDMQEYATGGISGPTHMLLGVAMVVGGTLLVGGAGSVDGSGSAQALTLAGGTVLMVGGVAEFIYGIVKTAQSRNRFR